MTTWLIWLIGAYLLGSVSFAMLLGRLNNIDIRAHGSGNVSATNLGRAIDKKWGLICFFLDLGKGLVPVVGYRLTLLVMGAEPSGSVAILQWLCVDMATVLGHVFPVFLKFKEGKGVAVIDGNFSDSSYC